MEHRNDSISDERRDVQNASGIQSGWLADSTYWERTSIFVRDGGDWQGTSIGVTMQTHPINNPSTYGAAVTIGSGAISFFAHTLVIVQWCAAAVAVIAGILSVAYTIKHWHTGHRK